MLTNYQVLMIDPPWNMKKSGLRKNAGNRQKEQIEKSRNLDYSTLSLEQIEQLLKEVILPMASNEHCLFVWVNDRNLIDCEIMFSNLGYKRHARFVWNKGNGFPAAFTVRFSHEYMIWYYKNKLLPIAHKERGKISTVFSEPSREHSRKPDMAYNLIDRLYPDIPKIDIFSREKREGWDQFGDECSKF